MARSEVLRKTIPPREENEPTRQPSERISAGASSDEPRRIGFDAALRVVQERAVTAKRTVEEEAIVPEIVTLLGLRPELKLSPHVVATWCRVLACFEIRDVRRAIVDVGLSDERFIGIQHLVRRIREIEIMNSPLAGSSGAALPRSLSSRIYRAVSVDRIVTGDDDVSEPYVYRVSE